MKTPDLSPMNFIPCDLSLVAKLCVCIVLQYQTSMPGNAVSSFTVPSEGVDFKFIQPRRVVLHFNYDIPNKSGPETPQSV
jgi:hypothetical protein